MMSSAEEFMQRKVSVRQAGDIDHTNAYAVTVTEFDETTEHVVWTGNDGKGLWIDGHQVEGRSQFSAGKNASAAIRRYFSR